HDALPIVSLCAACADEYHDPTDRRFHAQPLACDECGPRVRLVGADGDTEGTDTVVARVHDLLAARRIVAVKGLGGYHLAVDPRSDEALGVLRERKGRVDKPFAVMVRDLQVAERLAVLDDAERRALADPARPIVLVRQRPGTELSPLVAPGNPLVGLMLPYTPLHHLLFAAVPGRTSVVPDALVMTSGNVSEEPICFEDADAAGRLPLLADAVLDHDRPIHVPCDDSVVRVVGGEVQPLRRSRGYAPLPIALPIDVPPTIAVGGELKNVGCVATGRHAWMTQHVGDLGNLESLTALDATVRQFSRMYEVEPEVVAHDAHPDHLSRRVAGGFPGAAPVAVQHHHAHVAALLAEHGHDGGEPVIGVAFDGTGYGDDGVVWGGEVLVADYRSAARAAHLAALPLPGGDAAVRNPCRLAVAYLAAAGLDADGLPCTLACDDVERSVIERQVERRVGVTPTTSMGRLFDAVASILGIRHRITYEAQAAIELEIAAAEASTAANVAPFEVDGAVIDPVPVLGSLAEGVRASVEPGALALAFHLAVADAVLAVAVATRDDTGLGVVGLTGGVFQNVLLTGLVRRGLLDHGFDVLTHRLVPPNDGGLALGQALVAAHTRS
ncbi:MAG: carbamoyltransferase HypF, partial [Actinomycetota bacterium]